MQTTVSIPGMHCASCAALIKDISKDFPAIAKVEVDLERKTVTIDHRDDFDLPGWTAEVESLGEAYKVRPA
jgi:copper chaperone CopZ